MEKKWYAILHERKGDKFCKKGCTVEEWMEFYQQHLKYMYELCGQGKKEMCETIRTNSDKKWTG
jgi:hypothetical protein